MKPLVLGVDIGGTKVVAGLVDDAGKILSQVRLPMVADGSAEDAFVGVCRVIDSTLQSGTAPIGAIGVSSPGPLDPRSGVILKTPNLPCWTNFPLLERIELRYGLPTRVENDANAAGLAEAIWGAGAEARNVFYVTIGTGVGTAIILEKHIFHGRTGAAAEGGHMTIDLNAPVRCGCGKRGCLESLASGPAIAQRFRDFVRSSENGNQDGNTTALASSTTQSVFNDSDAGDPSAARIIQETTDILAVWMGNIIDLIEPDMIVIGGGVGKRLTSWLPRIAANIPRWSINPRASEIPLAPAHYGADSGLAGAAALWLTQAAVKHVAAKSE